MSAEIHYLTGNPKSIEQFIRVGHNGYRQLETLHSSGRVPISHAVIDAAHIDTQKDLVHTLREAGADIVLDTNIAELSSIGRFDGSVKSAPWANSREPLKPSDFKGHNKRNITDRIAEFCVEHNVDTVLSPSHLISSSRDKWVLVDL